MSTTALSRRRFLGSGSTAIATLALGSFAKAGEPPHVINPRATDGDNVQEPQWDERLTITVGPKNADLVGQDDKVLQAAVDYLGRLGGGTVHVLPGTYKLRNAVYLRSNIRILGSGADSIITKIASETISSGGDIIDHAVASAVSVSIHPNV